MNKLILSIFPGIDLLGRAFEAEGFCVVRGPDELWGGDIREFTPPRGVFWGIVGGSPCRDFSSARRDPPTGYGLEMIAEYRRVVQEAAPEWYLLENVPRVPDVVIPGYSHQRIPLNARECGSRQRRLRHFQWGSRSGYALIVERTKPVSAPPAPACLASEGSAKNRRGWPEFVELMGLPRDFDLPGWSIAAKYGAVGQGVPLEMGGRIAQAVKGLRYKLGEIRLCECGCGRIVSGRARSAGPACRKRLQRSREQKRYP